MSHTQVMTYHCDRCQQPIPTGERQPGAFLVVGIDGSSWDLFIGAEEPYEPPSLVDLCKPCHAALDLALTRAWRRGVRTPKS